jgi:hypothetical protein
VDGREFVSGDLYHKKLVLGYLPKRERVNGFVRDEYRSSKQGGINTRKLVIG